jgi:hypothetical protein
MHIAVKVPKNENAFPYFMTYKKSKEPKDRPSLKSLDPKKYVDLIRIMSCQDESSGGYIDHLTPESSCQAT